jgi:hypothetical protein
MTTPSDVTVSDQHGETWTRLPAPFSKYEWSADGFGPDQRPIRRAGAATGLATTVSNSGYLQVKPYDDDGKRQTIPVHQLILLGGTGVPCPPGQESRHLDDDPFNNRWRPGATDDEVRAAGGNLVRGTKKQNTRDKADNGRPSVAPKPFRCVNHARCGGMVANPGRRCLPCVTEVGAEAARLLDSGMGLDRVTRRLGYSNPEWVHKLARTHGGYCGTIAAARAQRLPWTRRVNVTVRNILRLGSGDGS